MCNTVVSALPFTPTIQQLPTNVTTQGKTGHVPSANACWIDLFTSSFPIHLLVLTTLHHYSRQPHTPCTWADEAFPPRDTSLATHAPWLHHLQRQWDSGSNHLPFCQRGEKQHANWAYQSLEVRIRLQAKLEMLVIVYEVMNRHQTTAQTSFGKWGKRYSPVSRCSKSKSHSPSFSSNFEPGLTHSGDCPSSCTFLP